MSFSACLLLCDWRLQLLEQVVRGMEGEEAAIRWREQQQNDLREVKARFVPSTYNPPSLQIPHHILKLGRAIFG